MLSTEDLIMSQLVDKVQADPDILPEIKGRIQSLWERNLLSDSNEVFNAITEDVRVHVKNSTA